MAEIYLAGGCFWGMEAYLTNLDGVISTSVGYANGKTKEPTYEEVCKGDTNHAETVQVSYDPKVIGLKELLRKYFVVIDPTTLNKQADDIGTQYRTGIYFVDETDVADINDILAEEVLKYESKIVTEVMPLSYYYPAEEYHQKYLVKNPNGYCHIKL